ncbi:FAD dependent oxidoreductase [Penicillium sp. DV-2018c]|nr:FAD dependent oxidoreductase [Penicillium sp. DV-2018c]
MSARALFKNIKLTDKLSTRRFSTTRSTNADFTHAVIGAGVVGLATARQLAAREGTSTILLERHDAPGTETSSRNSEVIHAGLYYPATSLKTNLCIHGRNLLYSLCAKHNIPHHNTKKWIVAQTPEQWDQCLKIHAHAQTLDAPTRLISADEAHRREPAVKADAGIVESLTTGIIDSHSLMTYLLGDYEDRGGDVAFKTRVTRVEAIDAGKGGYKITAVSDEDGSETSITAETLVNSAGHGACAISNMLLPGDRHFDFGACLSGYVAWDGGLGTHLTLDMGGRIRFGPDVEWVDSPDDLRPSAERLGLALAEIKAYLPGVDVDAIALDYCGIRPKLGRGGAVNEGKGFQDFIIREEEGFPGFVNLLGIESPGLTSCLAIGEMVDGILYR